LPPAHALFEVSWEVCNKVGGIHTVLSTKAKTLVDRHGDDYVAVGPWLLANAPSEASFEPEAGFEAFAESCRGAGVPVRVGRWKIPGSPRTVLVEFSGLYARKDGILAGLWEHFGVDSITGAWDYVEPVIFGEAAGIVIERWWQEYVAPRRLPCVAQFHEWMTASGLLYLKRKQPRIGTVFTTHATMLGRSISSTGQLPKAGLAGRTSDAAAESMGVRSKHSMEKVSATQADVFTTVSKLTAAEAELFFGRAPDPVLPNGIDLSVVDLLAGPHDRAAVRERVTDLARRFLGRDCARAAFLIASGRYEFHNKGIDLVMEAVSRLNRRSGRQVILLLAVPAGQSGVAGSVLERLRAPQADFQGALGLSTHNLNDPQNDPIQRSARRLGLDNGPASRAQVIQLPIYVHPSDGLFDLPYEALLRAMDLSLFPSFYEPWGYTPQESLAVGVPTVTSDLSGFGQWVLEAGLGGADGVHVLRREGLSLDASADALADLIETVVAEAPATEELRAACRRTAQRTAWSDLIANYERAFELAMAAAALRTDSAPPLPLRAATEIAVVGQGEGKRPRLFAFDVSATLPAPLVGLGRLAANFWWSWDPEGEELFASISRASWDACGHNPQQFLRTVFPEDLRAKAEDPLFLERLARLTERFDRYMSARGKPLRAEGGPGEIRANEPVAYFSAEFGVHECLRIYSGGLGILAGDHLKSASDLNLPLVGVGLFYRQGYLRQRVGALGEQIGLEISNDPRTLPVELVRGARGEPLEVSLPMPSSTLVLRAWRVHVGRVELYLLDSDVEHNRPEDRATTHQLYGGDAEHRLRQEIVLGRGGVRLLAQLGIRPCVYHINEGHAAFLALERVGMKVREQHLTFDEARAVVRATTAFTTHTPVPAGHDRFSEDLMRRYFSDAPDWMGLSWERFMSLGQCESQREAFNMTYLALAFSGSVNGVSRLHGDVSKELLGPFWPGLLRTELPVESVTNGVHLATWVRPELAAALGARSRAVNGADFARVGALDDRTLWDLRQRARRTLLEAMRERLQRSFFDRGDSPGLLARMLDGLEERALWIGFARRFAPYKRADLIFGDGARLQRLLSNGERPVRLVFAGKAHPRDGLGQELLKKVVALSRSEEYLGKVFFLEDYDMQLARLLVQGVDLWLNTPVRPQEASGTSGMKAAANGVLNLSVADGWWVEGFDGENGWTMGDGRAYAEPKLQDELDGASLHRLLSEEIAPLFFDRDAAGLPLRWLARVRRSLATIPPTFNTDRMVREYSERIYRPMAATRAELERDARAPLKALSARHDRVRRGFAQVKILSARVSNLVDLRVGDTIEAHVEVDLGPLEPADVAVELVFGHAQGSGDLRTLTSVRLAPAPLGAPGARRFEGTHVLSRSGSFSYGLRVRASETSGQDSALRDLVSWA
jgi:phosphorylase/glycogen(starch) synthase